MQKNTKDKLVVCSMYRSGGTLIFNILKYIVKINNLPFKVEKVHLNWTDSKKLWTNQREEFEANRHILFYSDRKVDDVVNSFLRRDKKNNMLPIIGMSNESFQKWILDQDKRVRQFAYCFNYERDIRDNELALQNRIEILLNVPQSKSSLFLRSEMKKYCDKLVNYDPETEFWPNHIS